MTAWWLWLESNTAEEGRRCALQGLIFHPWGSLQPSLHPSLSLTPWACLSAVPAPDQALCFALGSLRGGRMDERRLGFTNRTSAQVEVSSSHHFPLQASDFQGPELSRGFSRKTKQACERPRSAHKYLAFSGCSGNTTQSELDLLYLFPFYPCLQKSQIKTTQHRRKKCW